MKRKLVQFGDQINDLFVFPPFEEEEDWGDEVSPSLVPLQFADGSYRAGYAQSRKPQKTLTKRFTLYSADLIAYYKKNHADGCGLVNGEGYMTDFIDYMYRGLRGGVKRLYCVTEDGRIRYTYAEVLSIPYQSSFSDPDKWLSVSIDFIVHDSYWYDINDSSTFFYNNISMMQLINPCFELDATELKPSSLIGYNFDSCINNCSYDGVIVRNPDMAGYVGETCVLETGCMEDPCERGSYFVVNGNTTVEVCVKGSAGAANIIVTLQNQFTNPVITNTRNDHFISYSGSISLGQYLRIDLGSSITGDSEDYEVETNIPGFNIGHLHVNNDLGFELMNGMNRLLVQGGTSSTSLLGMNYQNRYHN